MAPVPQTTLPSPVYDYNLGEVLIHTHPEFKMMGGFSGSSGGGSSNSNENGEFDSVIIENSGTVNGLLVDQNGNGSAIVIDSEATSKVCLDINSAQLSSPALRIVVSPTQDSTAQGLNIFMGANQTADGIFVDHRGKGGLGIEINMENSTDPLATGIRSQAKMAMDAYCTVSGGYSLLAYRNLDEAGTYCLATFQQQHSSDTKGVIKVVNNGSGPDLQAPGFTLTKGALAATITDTVNKVGLTVTQNDTTNNPNTVNIVNTGTGKALYIDQNGNTGTSGAVTIDNTGNTGKGLVVTSSIDGTMAQTLVYVELLNSAADSPAFVLYNAGTNVGINIDQHGNDVGLYIDKDCTANNSRQWAMQIDCDNAGAGTALGCGINMSTFSATEPLLKVPVDAADVGEIAGQFAIDSNGTTYYVPFCSTGGNPSAAGSDVDTGTSETKYVTPKALADQTVLLKKSGGTLTGAVDLGENAGLLLDASLSADGKYSGITESGTAGAALAFGDLCYLNDTDSRWELADANLSDGYDKMLGICVLAAAGDGSATKMLLYGKVRADTAFPDLTIGGPAYLGETAGDVVTAAPTTTDSATRVVGFGLTANDLFFCPSNDYYTHT